MIEGTWGIKPPPLFLIGRLDTVLNIIPFKPRILPVMHMRMVSRIKKPFKKFNNLYVLFVNNIAIFLIVW